tara:strand:+ start:642 stop:1685 length:1044 start_codon:yes stop_codon:yes gene_type:complete
MARMCVLGGGLVGSFVASTLHERGHDVRVVDAEPILAISPDIECLNSRVNADNLLAFVDGFDVTINCLPGRIGHSIRKHLLSIEGMRIADLAFTAEDPRSLHDLAKKNNASLIYDVGIAPGLSNALLKAAESEMGTLQSGKIWVGGNPQEPDDEWSYMAPFSPSDVIEEYTRPARIRRNGQNVSEPALSERHLISVPGYGQMEAFLTDGVRSLLDTIDSHELLEYTVRWPGHIDRYLSREYSEDDLIEAWKFDSNRPEFTWLSVLVTNGQQSRKWDVIDEGQDGCSSMARTTGLVTVEVAEMLADGTLSDSGVMPPEVLGTDSKLVHRLIAAMRKAGVRIIDHSDGE